MTDRVVVLVDMDCFYVQVEERDHPDIKGVPAAVVQYNTWRGGGIIAVNYEARARGVKRNIRGDEAKSKCPDIKLIQVPVSRGKADLTKYRNAGKEVLQVLGDFTGRIERASIDEAYLDLTEVVEAKLRQDRMRQLRVDDLPSTWVVGAGDNDGKREDGLQVWLSSFSENDEGSSSSVPTFEHPHWDAQRLSCAAVICEEMRKAVLHRTGFKCSAGIAHNKMLAKLTCGLHKPNQQTVLPQGAVAGLWTCMPISKVRNLGGKLGDSVTEDLGCTTMADLAALSLLQLRNRYDDKTALWLHNMGKGIDHEPVTSRQLPKSIGCGKNFMGRESLNTRDKVGKWMSSLADELAERLEADQTTNKRRARTLTVSVRLDGDDRWTSISRSCPLPSYALDRITRLALSLIQHTNQAAPRDPAWTPSIQNISLSASKFEDWEGGSSVSIQAMFKKAALNKSLTTEKFSISMSEDTAGISTQLTKADDESAVSEIRRAQRDDDENDTVKSEDNLSVSFQNKSRSDDTTPAQSTCIQRNELIEQAKSPSNSFFKNFILKRKREAEEKESDNIENEEGETCEVENRNESNEGSDDKYMANNDENSDGGDDDGDDSENNLDLLLICMENEEENDHSSENNKRVTDNNKPSSADITTQAKEIEHSSNVNTSETSVLLSPDLFSSGGSSEAGDSKPKPDENGSPERKNPKVSIMPLIETPSSHTLQAEIVNRELSSISKSNQRTEISAATSEQSESTESQSCNVSIDELFPNLDDFDSSLLPLLPVDLRKMVEIRLAEHRAKNKSKASEKHGIQKYIQKSPMKTGYRYVDGLCSPGTSNSKAIKTNSRLENSEVDKSRKENTVPDRCSDKNTSSETVEDSEEHSRSKSDILDRVQEVEIIDHIKSSRNETGEGDDDDGGNQGIVSEMVECEECGKQISAFDLPEHMDFHVAVRLQSDLRRESTGVASGRAGKAEARRGRGRKRGKSGKVESSDHKLQRIDKFFTR